MRQINGLPLSYRLGAVGQHETAPLTRKDRAVRQRAA